MSTSATPAVIFDLDGTLVDSEPNYYEARRRLLAGFGVSEFTWEKHSRFIGTGARRTLEGLRSEYRLPASVEELLAVQNRLYLERLRESTEVFPEMRAFVERLHSHDVPMAVASGSSRDAIDAALSYTGLAVCFDATVSAEEVPHGKPEPDVFLEAARRLTADPADCVVVEDAVAGVTAAHAAGMRCIAVPYLPAGTPDPAFETAGMFFAGGTHTFNAQTAYEWIMGAQNGGVPQRPTP